MTRAPSRRLDVTATSLDDELILYEPGRRQPYVLNATAAEIWNWCDGSRHPSDIAHLLADAHGLARDQALLDVQDCLDELLRAGLLAR